MNISPIIIPTEFTISPKVIHGNGYPLETNKSIWSSALYEVWQEKEMVDNIYEDILLKIKNLELDAGFCIQYDLFSKKAADTLDSERLSILEGVKILGDKDYFKNKNANDGLVSSLQFLMFVLNKYIELRTKFVEINGEI